VEDFLARLKREVVALDMNVHLVRSVKKRLKNKKLDFVIADARHLPFSSNSFDLVFSQGLMEHFKDPSKIMSEQRRVAKYCLVEEEKVFSETYLKSSEEWIKELSPFGELQMFPYSKGTQCIFLLMNTQ
jgi:ubiquinone/menaquinone biosynthesis C-methylase UbiE